MCVCVCRKEAVTREVEKGIEGDRGGEAGIVDSAPTLPPTPKKCGYRDDVVPAAPHSSHLLVCRVPLDVHTHQSNKNTRRKQNLEREGRQGGRVRDDNAKKSKDDAYFSSPFSHLSFPSSIVRGVASESCSRGPLADNGVCSAVVRRHPEEEGGGCYRMEGEG